MNPSEVNTNTITIILVVVIAISIAMFILILFLINKKNDIQSISEKRIKEENFEKRIKKDVIENITSFIEGQLDLVKKYNPLDENSNASKLKKDAKDFLVKFMKSNEYQQYMLIKKNDSLDNLLKKLRDSSVMTWEKYIEEIKEELYGK